MICDRRLLYPLATALAIGLYLANVYLATDPNGTLVGVSGGSGDVVVPELHDGYLISPELLSRPNRWKVSSGDRIALLKTRDHAVITTDSQLRVVDLETGREEFSIPTETKIGKLGVSGDDSKCVGFGGQNQRSIFVFDLEARKLINRFELPVNQDMISKFAVSNIGDELAVHREGYAEVYDLSTGKLKRKVGGAARVCSVGFGSSTGQLAILTAQGTLNIYRGTKETHSIPNVYSGSLWPPPILQFVNGDTGIEINGDSLAFVDLNVESLEDQAGLTEGKTTQRKGWQRGGSVVVQGGTAESKGNPLTLELWDKSSKTRIATRQLNGDQEAILDVSATARFVLARDREHKISLIDLVATENSDKPPMVQGLQFLPGENRLFAQSAKSLVIWEGSKWSPISRTSEGLVLSSFYSPEKNCLYSIQVGGGQKRIRRVSLDDLEESELELDQMFYDKHLSSKATHVFYFENMPDRTCQLCYIADYTTNLFSLGNDQTVVFAEFDLNNGICTRFVEVSIAGLTSKAVEPVEKKVEMGKVKTNKQDSFSRLTSAYPISRDKVLFSRGPNLYVVDLVNGCAEKSLFTPQVHLAPVCWRFSTNSVLTMNSTNGEICEVDMDEMVIKRKVDLGLGTNPKIDLVDDNLMIAYTPTQLVFLELNSLKELHRLRGDFKAIAVSPDKLHLAIAGSDGALAIESIAELRKKAKWEVPAE